MEQGLSTSLPGPVPEKFGVVSIPWEKNLFGDGSLSYVFCLMTSFLDHLRSTPQCPRDRTGIRVP